MVIGIGPLPGAIVNVREVLKKSLNVWENGAYGGLAGQPDGGTLGLIWQDGGGP
jgi:hypothetical protein